MHNHKICILIIFLTTHLLIFVDAFRLNERVVFIGDSITHAGFYHSYIQTFYATRFPDRNIIIYNLGISGDTAKGGYQRTSGNNDYLWESDVLSYNPTAAIIMLGMNDASTSILKNSKSPNELEEKTKQQIKWFKDSYSRLLDNLDLLELNSVQLVKSSAYDQTMKNPEARENWKIFGVGKNDLIKRMAREVIETEAFNRNLTVIDFNSPMLIINKEQQQFDSSFSIVGKDRVHPGASGHMVMAYAFLKSQSLEGKISEVFIDIKKIEDSFYRNCAVKNLKISKDHSLSFDYNSQSIPFPDSIYESTKNLVDFECEFNDEQLIVDGLKDQNYSLYIDEEHIGDFSTDEYSSGINLSKYKTPQMNQANEVWEICQERARIASLTRNIVWSDNQLRKVEGLDRSNTRTCKTHIEKMLIENKSLTTYMKNVLKDYLEYIDDYSSLRKQIDKLGKQMYQVAQPKVREIKIIAN